MLSNQRVVNENIKKPEINSSRAVNKNAALPFSGRDYRTWLLEYYSIILRNIKDKMQKLGVVAGNIILIVDIKRTGIINEVEIASSDYGLNINIEIKKELYNLNLPPFPEKLNKDKVRIQLRIIYR